MKIGMRKDKKNIYLFLLVFLFSSCGYYYQDIEIKRATQAVKSGDFKKSVYYYSRAIKKSPESSEALLAASEAAQISLLKIQDFHSAIEFFNHIVLYSKDAEQRIQAQEKIAYIYLERLSNYERAIEEYSKLVALPLLTTAKVDFKIKIAKAFYYLNKFEQSIIEVNAVLEEELDDEQRFSLILFKSNVLLTQKKIEEAITELKKLKKDFPQKAKEEKISFIIAVAYEDRNEFEKAAEILNEIKTDYDDPGFIEIKLKRLKERMLNQPGKRKKK